MHIALFAIRLDRPLTDGEAQRLAALLPPARRQRIAQLRDESFSHEPLCAYAALLLGLHALYGWRSLPPMDYSRYGKPFFPDHPDVHFNLSHTRGAVLVGIHDHPLGVDIERIRPVSERTMRRLADTATPRVFFESWTRREARGKWGGAGLGAMLEKNSPTMFGERFEFPPLFDGYVACVCTHTDDPLDPVRCFRLCDLV